MSRRQRIDPRRIKLHRSYTIEELANLLGCHKNTARGWMKRGLKPLEDGKRPLLFQGREARSFLHDRRVRSKQKCGPDELYCFKCRGPRKPAAGMLDYRSSTALGGILSGLCADCSTLMFKRASLAAAERLTAILDVKFLRRTDA